jgi:peptide subunit release factor 1 (eRF1)
MAAERELADASDVGVAKRASAATGARGMTATDYAQRSQAEEARRLRADVLEAIRSMSGDEGGVILGGTREATAAARKELSEDLPERVIEVPELSFDTDAGDLLRHVRDAASRLTESRQARLLESCEDPRHGSTGWNGTHRALAAGAVDTLLISGDFIALEPDDAERIVRLALAQGAQVEEVSGELGARLRAKQEGIAARLRYVPASLRT